MPFNNPISPDSQNKAGSGSRKGGSGGLASLVQAEKLMQIAFVLPCSLLIGWGAGWLVDNHFHTHWATIAGLLLGIAAGMVSVVRMALDAGKPRSSGGGK